MQVTKKVIAPLIIMVVLAGVAGIMSSREMTINRSQKIQQASENPDLIDHKGDIKAQPEDTKPRTTTEDESEVN